MGVEKLAYGFVNGTCCFCGEERLLYDKGFIKCTSCNKYQDESLPPYKEEDDGDGVDLIASGYEWICPNCETFNEEIEATDIVVCKGCRLSFKVNSVEHAID